MRLEAAERGRGDGELLVVVARHVRHLADVLEQDHDSLGVCFDNAQAPRSA